MRKYIIMGVQGSGKGTQAKLLAGRLELEHISVGDIFGFIIDGFPRNQPQARFFLESYDLDAVILLEVPDQLVRDRILSRRLCSRCGVDYNLISSRPAAEGVCDVCGGRLVVRADDTPEVVEGRLRDYHDKTRPVLELFGAKEVIVAMDATGPVDQVQAAIREQLGVEPSSV
jgi:adenylate kinase